MAVNPRAMAAVSSVLSLSITMISSAHDTDSSAARRLADSLKVMTVAVTGTGESYRFYGFDRFLRFHKPDPT